MRERVHEIEPDELTERIWTFNVEYPNIKFVSYVEYTRPSKRHKLRVTRFWERIKISNYGDAVRIDFKEVEIPQRVRNAILETVVQNLHILGTMEIS